MEVLDNKLKNSQKEYLEVLDKKQIAKRILKVVEQSDIQAEVIEKQVDLLLTINRSHFEYAKIFARATNKVHKVK